MGAIIFNLTDGSVLSYILLPYKYYSKDSGFCNHTHFDNEIGYSLVNCIELGSAKYFLD